MVEKISDERIDKNDKYEVFDLHNLTYKLDNGDSVEIRINGTIVKTHTAKHGNTHVSVGIQDRSKTKRVRDGSVMYADEIGGAVHGYPEDEA